MVREALDEALFETMWLGPDGRLRAWEDHRARLERGLRTLGWPVPELDDLAARGDGPGPARIRLSVGPDGVAILEHTAEPPSLAARRRGLHAVTCAPPPCPRPDLKLRSQAALHAARAAEVAPAEPLYVDSTGEVLEGATWNVFALVDGRWWTPPADGRLLPGVTRARLLRACADAGFAVHEAPLPVEALRRAEAVIATNALLPLAPVCSLDTRPLPDPGRWLDTFRGLLGEPYRT